MRRGCFSRALAVGLAVSQFSVQCTTAKAAGGPSGGGSEGPKVKPMALEPSDEARRANVARPRATGTGDLVEVWRNPNLPPSSTDILRW